MYFAEMDTLLIDVRLIDGMQTGQLPLLSLKVPMFSNNNMFELGVELLSLVFVPIRTCERYN